MSKFTTIGNKEVYEGAKQMLLNAGYDPETARLTPSAIRSEVAMSTSLATYSFGITTQQANQGVAQYATEKRLNLQDVFVVSAMALYAANPSGATDGLFNLFSYGNRTAFATGGAVIDEAFDNGSVSIQIDNNQILPYLPTALFRKVPFTQQAANADYTTSGINLIDSKDGSNDGIFQVEPNIVMAGNSQFVVNLNLPAAQTTVDANSRWVLMFYGILAQNVSKIASNR